MNHTERTFTYHGHKVDIMRDCFDSTGEPANFLAVFVDDEFIESGYAD